jgi:hypothetical protein
VSTTASLNLIFPSSFRQSVKNFKSNVALFGILWYSNLVDWIISILKSIPKSGKYADIYFKSFYTESSLHIFNNVEIAKEATDLLLSVIKLSSSA